MSVFKVGEIVEWESQSAGSTTRKRGVVIATAAEAAGESPVSYAKRMFYNHRLMFDGLKWHPGGVLVSVEGGKTAKARPKLYMPKPGNLRVVIE